MAQSPLTRRAKGTGTVPSGLTGRLVIKSENAVGVTHWCPKEGLTWTCPGCGVQFVRDEDRRGEPWREGIGTARGATAGSLW